MLSIAAGLVALLAAAAPDELLSHDFDPAGEHNAFGWASTVATFSAAYASLLLALAEPADRMRLVVLSGCFAFLSLDDVATVHERLGAKVFHDWLDLSLRVAEQLEVVILAPVFAVALVVMWALWRELVGRTARVLLAGVSLLGLAIACELAGVVTRRLDDGRGALNAARIAVEEAAELAGWILVAAAVTALACDGLARSGGSGEARGPATR